MGNRYLSPEVDRSPFRKKKTRLMRHVILLLFSDTVSSRNRNVATVLDGGDGNVPDEWVFSFW